MPVCVAKCSLARCGLKPEKQKKERGWEEIREVLWVGESAGDAK